MKLLARPHDDLSWKIEGEIPLFEFDLGLADPYFPLEDDLHFQALSSALTHFAKEVWPRYPDSKAILYRGSADFSRFFRWSEKQENNFQEWRAERPCHDEAHLKRLFCAEAFVTYFQMLAHRLPDELPLTLILDPKDTGTPAQTLHLLSPERFEHFHLETGLSYSSQTGICFPGDALCTPAILEQIDALIAQLPSFRPVYEPLLTEQWDGLDELYVFSEGISSQGKRKLMGFSAAGGTVMTK